MEYYITQLNNLKLETKEMMKYSKHCHHSSVNYYDSGNYNCNNCRKIYENISDDMTLNEIKNDLLKLSRISLFKYQYGHSYGLVKIDLMKEINECAKILYGEITNLNKEEFNVELMNRNSYLENENKKLKEKLAKIKSIGFEI